MDRFWRENLGEVENLNSNCIWCINTCVNANAYEESEDVLVPATSCSDGSLPKYDINTSSRDPAVLCAHSNNQFSKAGRYVDSYMTVNPGDL